MGLFISCFHRPSSDFFPSLPHPDRPPSRRKSRACLVVKPLSLLCTGAGQISGRGAAASALQHSICAGLEPGIGGQDGSVFRASLGRAPWVGHICVQPFSCHGQVP